MNAPSAINLPRSRTDARLRGMHGLWLLCAALSFLHVCFVAYLAIHQLSHPSLATRHHLDQLGWSGAVYTVVCAGSAGFLLLGCTAIGLLIARKRWSDWMAVFVSLFLIGFGALFAGVVLTPDDQHGMTLGSLQPLADFVSALGAYMLFTSLGVIFYLFPNGEFVPPWTRVLAVGMVLLQIPWSFMPAPYTPDFWPLPLAAGPMVLVWGAGPLSQIYRYRCVSDERERRQTKWIVLGLAFLAASILLLFPLAAMQQDISSVVALPAFALVLLALPTSIGIAILRDRLWDIDLVINRALVYGAMTASVIGTYILAVVYLGTLFGSRDNLLVSLAATGVVAVAFQPVRARVQRAVDRLTYGDRNDPYAVLSRLGERLEAALVPDAVLPTIVETVKDALKLPYVAVTLEPEGKLAASTGEPRPDLLRVRLAFQGATVGELLLASRTPGEKWDPRDERLLGALAHQAGVAVHGVRVMSDLQQSRERLVLAREEERRRLRRDLHDELAPAIAALALTGGAVEEVMTTNPEAALSLLRKLNSAMRATVGDIRRLVYELRPPVLDELGLADAIRERCSHYSTHTHLSVTADIPEPLPELPAAVEVAAYRIALEALMNVVRHAQARSCTVRVRAGESLEIVVSDDGVGLSAQSRPGVGLRSMRERAEELGGACVVDSPPEGGTTVRTSLPIAVYMLNDLCPPHEEHSSEDERPALSATDS